MSEKCYTFAMTFPDVLLQNAMAEKVVAAVSSVEGFLAVHPEYPYVMPIFDTLEHAIRGREVAMEMGQSCANNIMNARIERETATLIMDSPAWGPNAKEGNQ